MFKKYILSLLFIFCIQFLYAKNIQVSILAELNPVQLNLSVLSGDYYISLDDEKIIKIDFNDKIELSSLGSKVSVEKNGQFVALAEIVQLISSDSLSSFKIALLRPNAKTSIYPNILRVNSKNGTLKLINSVGINQYVAGVIESEIGNVKNLELLKADAYFLCGPEQMIVDIVEVLNMFGVAKDKIHYELFTTPTMMKPETEEAKTTFKGESDVTVILDGEKINFKLKSDGKPILDILDKEGFDAPYSCRGGVCCSCKAKVLSGEATMKLNYVLTEQEVKDGYVLMCQAHPASDELTVSFDA